MDDDGIKIEYIAPIGPLTPTEAEILGLAMAGQWFPMPVRYMTREELEKEFPLPAAPSADKESK